MAISKIDISANDITRAEKIHDALEALGFFESVTLTTNIYDMGSNTEIICKIANNQQFMKLQWQNVQLTSATLTVNSSPTNENTIYSSQTIGYTTILTCTNGCIISCDSGSILITKTNNDDVCIVANNGLYGYQAMSIIAWNDVAPFNKFSYTPTSRNQTEIVPFVTCSDIDRQSYTPNAGYMPFTQYDGNSLRQYFKMTLDDEDYITDGFWVIRDTNLLTS